MSSIIKLNELDRYYFNYINVYDNLPILLNSKEIINLINEYKEEYSDCNIYHYSDPHFNQDYLFKQYRNTIFDTVGIMNKKIVSNIFKYTSSNDIIICHGDVFDAEPLGFMDINEYMNDIKDNRLHIFILGNHDKIIYNEKSNSLLKIINALVSYKMNAHILSESYIMLNNFTYLSHEPLQLELYNFEDMMINICGHNHPGETHPIEKDNGNGNLDPLRYFNCALDYIDFKPIKLSEIYKRMNIILC